MFCYLHRAIYFAGLLCLGLLIPFAAESRQPIATAAYDTGTQQSIAVQRGSLYRIRHHGNTSYLFGTIHVGKPEFYPLEPKATQALLQATALVVEVDINDTAALNKALTQYGMAAPGDTLHRHLAPKQLKQLERVLQKVDIRFEQIGSMKPWLAAHVLLQAALEKQGYQASQGIDMFLLSVAKTQEKKILTLESVDDQLSLFGNMTAAQQARYLIETTAEIDNGTLAAKTKELMDAWQHADGAALAAILRTALQEKTVSAEFMQRLMLDQRNPNMARRIETLLDSEKSIFVGVGMLHLIGNKGLPQLLKQHGYSVEKLY